MSLSHTQLCRWYANYNARWFGGRLPADVDVFYAPLDGCAECAAHANGERVIIIDTRVAGRRHSKGDLLHEMNHLDTDDWTHGRKFQAGMKRLALGGAFNRIW